MVQEPRGFCVVDRSASARGREVSFLQKEEAETYGIERDRKLIAKVTKSPPPIDLRGSASIPRLDLVERNVAA